MGFLVSLVFISTTFIKNDITLPGTYFLIGTCFSKLSRNRFKIKWQRSRICKLYSTFYGPQKNSCFSNV